jgi:hypothetical protein
MERFSSAMMKSEAWAATKLDQLRIARKESFTQQLATMRRGNTEVPKRASRGQKAPRRRIARATIVAVQRNEAESTAVRRLATRKGCRFARAFGWEDKTIGTARHP